MSKRSSAIRWAISAGVFALFLIHTARVMPLRLLDVVEAFTYDARVTLNMPGTPDPRVVILDIDERSLAAEGWPWPRTRFAHLVDQLFDRYKISVLGFDIVFAEADDNAQQLWQRLAREDFADVPAVAERAAQISAGLDYDGAFARAVQGRPVVLGYFFKPIVQRGEAPTTGGICAPLLDAQATKLYDVDFMQAEGYGGNVERLQAATPGCGFFDNPIAAEDDGVFRRVPLLQQFDGAVYPSLALAVVARALGNPPASLRFDPPDVRTSLHLESLELGDLSVPVDERVAAYVPYRGDNRTFTFVSAVDVLNGTLTNPEVLQGAIVLVGATAAGLLDLRSTPVNKVFNGVEVHANLVSGMLDGRIPQKAPYYSGIETVLHALIAILLTWTFSRLSPGASAGVGVAVVIAVIGMAFGMWSGADFIMPMGVPVAFTLSLFMAHLMYGYLIESRGKRKLSRQFGQYVPPQVVEEMAERPEAISMDGESREMTVLFSDVRDFTSISEQFDARTVAALMNQYLTPQTAVIQKYRGTIDKYMGDAIMAFWGAPLPDPRHASQALLAALELIKSVRSLDAAFEAKGWPRLNIGIGINSGRMSVGNMGSEFRVAYTVMGDAVNHGSRLEALTKIYGSLIICSESTRNAAPPDWSFRELDRVRVKGKREPVAIYEPMGPKNELDPGLREDLARQRGALKLYRDRNWDAAELEFFNLMQGPRPHPVYQLFIERIMYLREHPPGADWDGAFTFEHK